MSQEGEESSNVLLQKLHDETKHNFPRMFLHHNEHGVSATLLLEMLKGTRIMYGEYSEMSAYIEHILDSFDASILSSASIDGNMRNSFLIKKMVLTQNGNFGDPNQQKNNEGFFAGLGKMFGKNRSAGQQDLGRL